MVRQFQDDFYGGIRSAVDLTFTPDFVKLGEAYGMRALRLESLDQTEAAVREAVAADRSTLIEVPLQLRPPRL
jgi:acetolactate synthase-1/2/3 large subunit